MLASKYRIHFICLKMADTIVQPITLEMEFEWPGGLGEPLPDAATIDAWVRDCINVRADPSHNLALGV